MPPRVTVVAFSRVEWVEGDRTGRPYIADHIAPDQVEAWAAAMLEGTEKDAGVKKKKARP